MVKYYISGSSPLDASNKATKASKTTETTPSLSDIFSNSIANAPKRKKFKICAVKIYFTILFYGCSIKKY